MPRIQTYERRVSQTALKAPGGVPHATAESFGAAGARQLGQIGQAVGNVANALMQDEIRKNKVAKGKQDYALASERIQQANDAARNEMSNYYNKKGADAANVFSDSETWFRDSKNKFTEGLSEDQIAMFDQGYNRISNKHLDRMVGHQRDQADIAFTQAKEAENQIIVEDMVVGRHDNPEEQKARMAELDANSEVIAATRGLEGKAKEKYIADAKHTAVMTTLKAVKGDSVQAAKKYFDENKEFISPVLRESVGKELAEGAMRERAEDTAKSYMFNGLNEKEVEKEINKIKDPQEAKETSKRYSDMKEEKTLRANATEMAALEKEADAIRKDPDKPIDTAQWSIKSQDYLYSLKQRALKEKHGGEVKTPKALVLELRETKDRKELKEKLIANAGIISGKHWDEFTKIATTEEEFKASQTKTSYVSQFVKKEGGKDEIEKHNFMREMFDAELQKYPEDQRDKIETWNRVKDTMMLSNDGGWFGLENKYWEAKMKGKEFEPSERPAEVPKSANWVDTVVGGTPYRGWEFTNPQGVKTIYSDGQWFKVDQK